MKFTVAVNSTGFNHYSVRAAGYPGGAAFGTQTLGSLGSPTAAMFTNATLTTPAVVLDAYGDIADCPLTTSTGVATCLRGTMTLTFSQPVTNPTLHFGGMGNNDFAVARTFHPVFALVSSAPAGVTFTRLSGNTPFAINTPPPASATITNGAAIGTVDVSCTANAAACGTVRVNGAHITQLTFDVYLRYRSTTPWLLINSANNSDSYDGHVVAATVPPPARVRIAKISNSGTGTFGYTMTNLTNTADSVTTTTAGTAITSGQTNLVLAHNQAVTITENAVAGYSLAGAVCVDANAAGTGNPSPLAATLSGATVTIPANSIRTGSDITCTFTNTGVATLRIQKTRVGNAGGPQTFNFTGDGPGTGLPGDDTFSFGLNNSTSLTHDYGTTNANTATPGTTALNNLVAGTYTITESFTEGANEDFELTSISCVNQAGGVVGSTMTPTLGANGGSASISLVPGANYLCTFTNTRDPKITLTKQVQGAGATFGFSVTATGTGSVTPAAPSLSPATNGSAQTTIDVSAATTVSRDVTITENPPPAGYVLASVSCTKVRMAANGSTTSTTYTGSTATRAVTIVDMTPNDTASCTFVNAQQPTLVIRKQTVGGFGSFAFTGTNGIAPAGATLTTSTTTNPVASASYNVTTPGQPASITETIPAGWALTSASCVDANNITVGGTTLSGGTLTIPGGATTGGMQLTCTFVNARQPTLRVQKQLPNGRFAATDQFTLSITGAGGPASVTTTGSGTTATGVATIAAGTAGTSYTFSEAGASGANLGNYTTSYSCTNAFAGGTTVAPGSGSSFDVTPQAGDDLTCTFVNTRNPVSDLSITKQNDTPTGGTVVSGATTTYTVTVTNTGPDAVTGAVVTDTPTSGLTCPGTNPDTVTCSGPACTGAAPLTVSGLTSGGIVLGTLPAGQSTTLTFSCVVN